MYPRALCGRGLYGSTVEGGIILIDAVDEAVAEFSALYTAEVKSHWGYSLLTNHCKQDARLSPATRWRSLVLVDHEWWKRRKKTEEGKVNWPTSVKNGK
jgi:hypothetical protein